MTRARTSLAALMASCAVAAPAAAQEVEVVHWLTAGAESEAIQTLVEGVEARGATWVDLATPGGGGDAQALFSSRIAGGESVGAMFMSIGPEAIELGEQGAMRDVAAMAAEADLISQVPDFVLDLGRTEGGEIYALPVGLETQNFMWTSPPAFEKAGMEPVTGWQELIDAAPALEEAGVIPIAVGEQGWQLRILMTSVLASVAGPEGYLAILARATSSASSTRPGSAS